MSNKISEQRGPHRVLVDELGTGLSLEPRVCKYISEQLNFKSCFMEKNGPAQSKEHPSGLPWHQHKRCQLGDLGARLWCSENGKNDDTVQHAYSDKSGWRTIFGDENNCTWSHKFARSLQEIKQRTAKVQNIFTVRILKSCALEEIWCE